MEKNHKPDMTWWTDARFGMFIHWGLYAIPGGVWKGRKYKGVEWLMNRARIPVAEYEQLAGQFNPEDFSAREIVSLAVDAGMKYLVITSKHHDGFALFKSRASSYNVVDATPFKRDIVEKLAGECARQGIRFGLYYSQAQDWHHKDAAGNTWDWPDEEKKDFQRYLDDLVYPQVDEILSNYGPISVLWFDTPQTISADQSRKLLSFVRDRQPDCIVNSRLGPGGGSEWGDFVSLRDNEVPTIALKEHGETCATLNGNWGYSREDSEWKSAPDVVRTLADVAAKNANYLLNIGPDGRGNVPLRSVEILKEAGRWIKENGESIYHSCPTPFSVNFDWGAATSRDNRVYFHLFDKSLNQVKINGLQNSVNRAFFLDAPNKEISVSQTLEKGGIKETAIAIDRVDRGGFHRVLALELEGKPDVHKGIIQQPDGRIVLESLLARDSRTDESMADKIMFRGAVANSLEEGMELSWAFEVLKPGNFTIMADSATGRYTDHGGEKVVDRGHEVTLSLNNRENKVVIREEERHPIRGNVHWMCILSPLGKVTITETGPCRIDLKINKVVKEHEVGFILRNLTLTPV